jgi:hypothetical protein
MLFMVIERFKNQDAKAIYSRLADKGRMMPDGLRYVGSWIETNYDRCFQVMETEDERLLHEWADHWRDLMEFEFVPVRTSEQSRAVALGEGAAGPERHDAGACDRGRRLSREKPRG